MVTPRAHLPNHIAIIMDGNGRWAQAKNLPRATGHETGVDAAERAVRGCHERNIPFLTLYAFSMANWRRPPDEVHRLMRLCGEFAEKHRQEYVERGIRVRVIGDLEELPTETRHKVEHTMRATEQGDCMVVTLALSYSGRNDLVGAARAIAARAHAGLLLPEEIDEQSLRRFMSTGGLPDPDLLIRTGGERRLSDFLVFECANAELYFSDVMWPDFDDSILDDAITTFGRRQRRFGKTSEQVALGA